MAKRLLLSLAIAAASLGMVALGFWQLDRLAERRVRNAEISARLAEPPVVLNRPLPGDPDSLSYRQALARGVYDFANEVVLRNRAYQGVPGGHVLTPLRLAPGEAAVLVDRGWLPLEALTPERRAAYHAPQGEVEVAGLLRPAQTRPSPLLPADPTLAPGQDRLEAWFWVDLERIEAQLPYSLLPVYLEAAPSGDAPQLPISQPEVDLTEGPHLAYAFQWFAFALILAGGSLAYAYQQRRRKRHGAAAKTNGPR